MSQAGQAEQQVQQQQGKEQQQQQGKEQQQQQQTDELIAQVGIAEKHQDASQRVSNHPVPQQQQEQEGKVQPEPIQKLGNCKLLHRKDNVSIWECADFCGRPCVIKQCAQQAAKHPLLARKLAKQPCQQDVAGMCRVRKLGVPTPVPLHVSAKHNLVYMSAVEGGSLQQRLDAVQQVDAGVEQLLSELGRLLAIMHDGGVVHAALSSDAVLVRDSDLSLLLRDFECFTNTLSPKDKAADLVSLEAALQEQHPTLTGLFDKVLAAYNKHSKQWSAVFNRLPEARNQLQKHHQGPGKKKARTK